MKLFRRCISLFLVLVLVLVVPVCMAQAAEQASSFFIMYDAFIEQVDDLRLEIWFDVVATGTMDVLGVSEIQVEYSTDGVNWEEANRTYRPTGFPQMLDENSGAHAGCVTMYYSSEYHYRAHVTFYAENSTGTGMAFKYTEAFP